jgi:Uncharacterized protein conserved in bacteria (DUF2255)
MQRMRSTVPPTTPTTHPARPCRSGWSGSVTVYTSGPAAVPPAAGTAAPGAMAADRVAGVDHTIRFTAADSAVRPQVDEAYRAKYGWYGSSYVRRIISDNIAETTLHLQPTISTQRPRAGAESRDLPLTDSPDSLCGRCWIAHCHSFEVDREPVRSSTPWRKTAV